MCVWFDSWFIRVHNFPARNPRTNVRRARAFFSRIFRRTLTKEFPRRPYVFVSRRTSAISYISMDKGAFVSPYPYNIIESIDCFRTNPKRAKFSAVAATLVNAKYTQASRYDLLRYNGGGKSENSHQHIFALIKNVFGNRKRFEWNVLYFNIYKRFDWWQRDFRFKNSKKIPVLYFHFLYNIIVFFTYFQKIIKFNQITQNSQDNRPLTEHPSAILKSLLTRHQSHITGHLHLEKLGRSLSGTQSRI